MLKSLVFLLLSMLVLSACSQRGGYEVFRQMGYQECLKQSPRPAEDCRYAPDFDQYQQQRKARYAE
jgi:hypothetical protein